MPDFPNRPDHPDFWLMAEIVQDLDAAADDGLSMQRIIGPVDAKSLAYMAGQRGLRAKGLIAFDPRAALGAAWLDGFMAGVNFQKRKNG